MVGGSATKPRLRSHPPSDGRWLPVVRRSPPPGSPFGRRLRRQNQGLHGLEALIARFLGRSPRKRKPPQAQAPPSASPTKRKPHQAQAPPSASPTKRKPHQAEAPRSARGRHRGGPGARPPGG